MLSTYETLFLCNVLNIKAIFAYLSSLLVWKLWVHKCSYECIFSSYGSSLKVQLPKNNVGKIFWDTQNDFLFFMSYSSLPVENKKFNWVYFHLSEIYIVVCYCFVVVWHNSPVHFTSGNGIFERKNYKMRRISIAYVLYLKVCNRYSAQAEHLDNLISRSTSIGSLKFLWYPTSYGGML